MPNTWTRICQDNLDHYNNHPAKHNALTVAAGVVALVVIHKAARKIATEKPNPYVVTTLR